MPAAFYSPNSKNTGASLFIKFNSKDGGFFFNLVKQVAWDEKTKKASFSGGQATFVKFSQDEVAGIIRAVRTNGFFSFYHTFDKNATTGSLKFYSVEKEGKTRMGFGFSVKQGESEFKIGLSEASAERLSLYLKNGLTRCFDADYANDVKTSKEYAEKKLKEKSVSNEKTVSEEKTADEPQSDENVPDF